MKNIIKVGLCVGVIGAAYCAGYASCIIDELKLFVKLYNNEYTIGVDPINRDGDNNS